MKPSSLKEYNPMHPGEFIKVTFCEPLNIDVNQLSKMLDLDTERTEQLLNGTLDITPELATLLATGLGRSRESWLIMQNHFSEYHIDSLHEEN